MLSAKFYIIGEVNKWLRIRAQEEVYAHGLEGTVLVADENTLVIVVEGDKSKIKRLFSDMKQGMPESVQLSDLSFSLARPTRNSRIKEPDRKFLTQTQDYILQYLRELERKSIKADQKLDLIISILRTGEINIPTAEDEEDARVDEMDVDSETASGFATIFGNI